MTGTIRARFSRRRVLTGLAIVVVIAGLYALVMVIRGGVHARSGRAHLERAASALRGEHIPTARQELRAARADFVAAQSALDALGPLSSVLDVVPLVRIQLRGLDTMTDVGVSLSDAGLHLTDAAAGVLSAQDSHHSLAQSVPQLQAVQAALHDAVTVLAAAQRRTAELDGYRLLGPLDTTRDRLVSELASSTSHARRADAGMSLVLWVVGVDGPTRLLVFSQNPDEIRPTGGYMGTFGVIAGRAGHVQLLDYSAMRPWVLAHPDAVVPVRQAPTAFGYATPPQPQQFPNVNATPDWPQAGRLASKLWRQGGEQPVDGAFSLMPQTMARIVGVLGPVTLPAYGETVTERNLVDRLDFYTHREAVRGESATARKQFIVDLAHAVVRRVLHAPSSSWGDLGKAMAASFDAGEALMWTRDPATQSALQQLGWAGAMPDAPGDFYAEAEFEYIAKNGGALRRTFTHTVTLHADGSGVATTTMLLRDTAPYEQDYNDDSLSYITPYGPLYSSIDGSSDPPDAYERPLNGHPAQGYLRAAKPRGSTSLTVTFRSRVLALPRTDGSLLYTLDFRGLPGHRGDVLRLDVSPPAGWRWEGAAPPTTVPLYGRFHGVWALHPA